MLRHKLGALMCAGITAQLLGGVAHAATFTAGVDPTAAGSAQKPQAHTTAVKLGNIDPGLGGNAKSAVTTLVESLPADFTTTLSHYSSCSANVVVHGDNKPNCPNSSVVGSASAVAYVPALAFSTTSDQGYIFKIDDSTVRVWVHVSNPIPAGVVVQGKISRGAAPSGPVITWDFTPLADGAQTGSEVRVNRVDFTFDRQAGAKPSSSASRPSCKAPPKKSRRKGKRRRKSSAHCAKPKPAGTSTDYAPFVSTGCSTGNWPFEAQMTFADNTTQTASTSVACTKAASDSPPPPPPPAGGPLCPPVCAASAKVSPLDSFPSYEGGRIR